jgi:hypothetical protein
MAITSEASPYEVTSPFYKINEEICLEWERIITEKGGTVNGRFSAWAYKIEARFKTKLVWDLVVLKSSYSGNARSISNKWNVFENFNLKTVIDNSNSPDFIIQKRSFLDNFKSNTERVSTHPKYVIIGASEEYDFVKSVIGIISGPLKKNKVYKVAFKENKLEIIIPYFDESMSFVSKLMK